MCKYTQTPAAAEQANSRSRRGLVGPGAVRSCALSGGAEQGAEFAEPIALAVDVDDRNVVEQAVEDGGGQDSIVGKDFWLVPHVSVGGEEDRAAFVAGGDEAEEEIRFDPVEGTEADLVDDEQPTVEVAPRA